MVTSSTAYTDALNVTEDEIKRIDLETALCIASLGGIPTHDTLGNLLPSVWCKHAYNMDKETGVLLETDDLRKILLEQLQKHIGKRQDLILETEDTGPLVQWIMDFTEDWEDTFRKREGRKYDISQKIYAAMLETFQILETEMRNVYGDESVESFKARFANISSHSSHARHFSYDKAAVRALFRFMPANSLLCKLASKVLQKQEVCNRAGAYSSKIQRSDVTLQLDDAVHALQEEFDRTNCVFEHTLNIKNWNLLTRDFTQDSHTMGGSGA